MLKKLFIVGLVFASLGLQSCNSVTSQTSNSVVKIETSPQKDEVPKQQKVEFKGVSFTYNPQIFGEVKTKEVAEYALEAADFKPDGVEPQHRLFTFDSATGFSEMYLAVYPINDFPRMYAVDKGSVKAMEKEIRNLKKVLKDENFRVEGQIPYLPFFDASISFYAKVKHFSFPSGQGILFLTQYGIGYEIVSNHNLTYVFEGLTADKKYYVLAELAVSVDFLPKEQTDEFEGYKIPWNKLRDEAEMKKLEEVNQKIGKRLGKLPSNEFNPDLKYFEEIISSLKIEK